MKQEMIQASETGPEIAPQEPRKEKGVIGHFHWLIREIIAALFWIYVVVKLFVFDVDIFLLERFSPDYVWLLNYKFFILIGTIATIWLVTKNRHILLWMLYICFYPAIVLLWRIPFLLFKQKSWILAFALFDALISFFRSIKFSFISAAFFLVSLAIIFGFSNENLLWPSIVALIVVLLVVYLHRFFAVFKPSGLYQAYDRYVSKLGNQVFSSFSLDQSVKNLPVENLDEKQLATWTTNLQMVVLYNRILLFAARRLKAYQNSGLNVVSSVLIILVLTALTIIAFAAINFGLYKINPHFFAFSTVPNFFTFFYYSFNNLLSRSIQEIIPAMTISQTASMIETSFALFLLAIFVSLLLSVRSQRYADELNAIIKGLEEQGTKMESFVRDEYKLNNIEDAMAELQKLKSILANLLYKITENIK